MPAEVEALVGRSSLRVEVGPSFQAADARRLAEVIRRADPGVSIDVDFREVRDCDAAALAQLARVILDARARVALRGMSHHHERLLDYLGVLGPSAGG